MARAVKRGSVEEALQVLADAANTAREKAAVRSLQGVFGTEGSGPAPEEPESPGRRAARDAMSSRDPRMDRSAAARFKQAAGSARGEVQPAGQGHATAQPQR